MGKTKEMGKMAFYKVQYIMKYSIIILSLITLQSCAQSQILMNKERNTYKAVKHREQSINYQAVVYIGGCNYELLINDMPIDNYFGPANGAKSGSNPINSEILKSGMQTWKIRVYPEHTREIIKGKIAMIPKTSISKGARVELSIEGVRYLENGNIEKLGKVLDFEGATTIDPDTEEKVFADAGKPYIEYSGTFMAEVPYELTGWSKSQDLSKEDSDKIKEEVIQAYKEASEIIKNKDLISWEEKIIKRDIEVAQALFFNKSESAKIAKFHEETFAIESFEMVPLDNIKVVYYGNGKIVGLERSDVLGEKGLIIRFVNKEGNNRMRTFDYLLHKPEGSDKLEVIR